MREIKFRAWCKRDEMMYYNIQNGITFDDGSRYSFENFLGCQDDMDYHRWTLMQFIGRLDKNNEEIYESDIAKDSDGIIYEVRYNILRARFCYYREGHHFTYQFGEEQEQIEIIGNIYESPELLIEGEV